MGSTAYCGSDGGSIWVRGRAEVRVARMRVRAKVRASKVGVSPKAKEVWEERVCQAVESAVATVARTKELKKRFGAMTKAKNHHASFGFHGALPPSCAPPAAA